MKPTDLQAAGWHQSAVDFVARLARDRGSRSQLRRATTPPALYGIELAHGLVDALGLATPRRSPTAILEQERAYRLASLLAWLPEDAGSVAESFGAAMRRDNRVSPLRFGRLLRTRKPSELQQQFRRALAQIKYRCHPGELAHLFLRWHTESVQRGVAYEYFQTSAPEPFETEKSVDATATAEQE